MTLQERFTELNTSSSTAAAAWARLGRTARTWHFIGPPLRAFIVSYCGSGGWRRGVAGLTSALFDSYAVLATYAKLWEIQHGFASEPAENADNAAVDPRPAPKSDAR